MIIRRAMTGNDSFSISRFCCFFFFYGPTLNILKTRLTRNRKKKQQEIFEKRVTLSRKRTTLHARAGEQDKKKTKKKHNFSVQYLCNALVLSSFFGLSGGQKLTFLLVYFICKKRGNRKRDNFGFSS